jgi:tetratricopeptide (TPR) repeat protein
MNRISAGLLLLVMGCSSCGVRAQGSHEPLRETQLLALVAGAALPENIVAAIRDHGVSFTSDADFRARLEAVGADPRILEALDAARVIVPEGAKEVPSKEVQKRIVDMATRYQSEKFPDDPRELLAVIKDAQGNPESGFVMGQMLRQQELFPQAEYVYGEVLSDNPDFPEVHTKLSYILHRLEDEEAALREAKAALQATPDNAEAHKNAGLALAAMRKFDAADAEYEAALRRKPDYEPVRYAL